jgi:tRNA A-37 threonylcarbamoyl transferase component Bud32
VGLKFKYQFDDIIAARNAKKLKNSEVDEPIAKKLKLNDNKITTILEYSSVQLPVAPFIDYLEKFSNTFVNQCLKYSRNSLETTD